MALLAPIYRTLIKRKGEEKMLCGVWKVKKEEKRELIRICPEIDQENKLSNFAAALLSAVLFEKMEKSGIPTVYENFWNGQKVWKQEPIYLRHFPNSMSEGFIVKKLRNIDLDVKDLMEGAFCGILPIHFLTMRERDSYWRGCFIKEDEELKSVFLLDVVPKLGTYNLQSAYRHLTLLIERVNKFFISLFPDDWLVLDKLDLQFAIEGNYNARLVAFDFQLSFHGVPIVLNYDFESKIGLYPQTINIKNFNKDETELNEWERSSKNMYYFIVNHFLELDKNVFTCSNDFHKTVMEYIDAFYMMTNP